MATLQNIGKLKYRGKDGQWHDLPVVVQDADGSVSTISGKGAPTSATQGAVNQLYRDEDTQKLYICTAEDGGGYTWAAVSGGSVDVDATLTKAGYAADAKAAGDAIGRKIDAPQVAKVGEVLTVEAVDEDGKPIKWKTAPAAAEQKQADWAQNDETAADYVKNRPFYEADEAPLGEIEFTAESASKITHTVNAMSYKVLGAIQSVTGYGSQGAQIRLFLCGKFYEVNARFDRGIFSFNSDEIYGIVYFGSGQEFYFEIQDNSIVFEVGKSYSVSFFDINNKGYVKIPFEYFPDSVFTQESAPVRYGDGDLSTIQGYDTTASGINSHAEGSYTTASGINSHAEGLYTTASGDDSHAEGGTTTASGNNSHTEGSNTKASGYSSHAEGDGTTASAICQHAQGSYNIPDTTSAHIVGNGESPGKKSNAHTLDWQGNAWFAGDVYVGSTSGTNRDDGSKKLVDTSDLLAFGQEVTYYVIPKPTTAQVGQIVKVKAVDASGKITETEAVDMPSVDYIIQSSTAGSTKKFMITVDDSGTISATEITD